MKDYIGALRNNLNGLRRLGVTAVFAAAALFGVVAWGCGVLDALRNAHINVSLGDGPATAMFVVIVAGMATMALVSGYVLWHVTRDLVASFFELAKEWWTPPLEETIERLRAAALADELTQRRPAPLNAPEPVPAGSDYW